MLVDYASDSDSDVSAGPSPPPAPTKPTIKASAIPGLNLPAPKAKSKLASVSATSTTTTSTSSTSTSSAPGTKKFIVSLPKASDLLPADEINQDSDQPPSKRARTTGGFADLGSLLPKPKRKGESGVIGRADEGSGIQEVKKRVLGGGAAKDGEIGGLVVEHEEALPGAGEEGFGEGGGGGGGEPKDGAGVSKEEFKGDAKKFVPSSVVGRRTIQPMSAFRKKGGATTTVKKPVSNYKPAVQKVDLFGAGPAADLEAKSIPSSSSAKAATYEPIIHVPEPSPLPEPAAPAFEPEPVNADPYAHLSESELRRLFGRGAKRSDMSSIPMATFNVDQEYDNNRRAVELGLVEQVANPVRSVAPGRHQLSSLLNIAQNQKEALEEHFAQGRRNKKESGSKYGW